jgi:hypothetical protein
MTCDELLELCDGGPLPEAAVKHLTTCADCRQTVEALNLAALPALGAEAREALDELPELVMSEWRARRPMAPVPRWHGWARMALAACAGALISTAVLSRPRVATVERPALVTPVSFTDSALPSLPESDDEQANLQDDEVFFDVSWPASTNPTEGEL